jgi:AraC family transcriptional regulator
VAEPTGLEPATSDVTGSKSCPSTVASRHRAIERAILAVRERLDEPLSLEDPADIAIISPYHFDRIFRQVIGIPPCQFLGALRIEAAKRLLLTTDLSVTEVCLEVGYDSLGTFTTRFTQLVGMAPGQLRKLAKKNSSSAIDIYRSHDRRKVKSDKASTDLSGQVCAQDDFEGLIFVGLFPTPIPQCRPVGCTLLTGPNIYHILLVPDGCYYLLAAAVHEPDWPLLYSDANHTSLQVGRITGPLVIEDAQINSDLDITLRPLQLTDPPFLAALPLLLDGIISSGVSTYTGQAGAANLYAAQNEQSKRRPEFALLSR